MASLNKWDARNRRNMATVQREIDKLFDELAREAALIASIVQQNVQERMFSFDDYPMTRQRVERLLQRLRTDVSAIALNGIDVGWQLANDKNDELVRRVFGERAASLSPEQLRAYNNNNEDAREAFKTRRENGLNLSDRVWRYSDQFKAEIEMGIDIGLGEGLSADELSRRLRSYLREPQKLFRRVRDKHGNLQLSKNAKAYHPGRGVYRSSYKNARRLAATETNIAYRSADYERYQQLDFVVGIRIELSNNHTLNGVPFEDICDQLSAPLGSNATKGRGCYPKDFKFTGWHPLCRCTTFSILKTEEEIDEDTRRILAGEPIDGNSVNRVEDVPDGFKQWIGDNADRITNAKSLPYFIRDNKETVDAILNPAKHKQNKHEIFKLSELASNGWNVYARGKNGMIPLKDVEDIWNNTDFSKMDFYQLQAEIKKALQDIDSDIDTIYEIRYKPNSNRLSISIKGGDVTIERDFGYDNRGLFAHHALFTIPEELQGRGTSKAVLGAFLKQYEKIGVKTIKVYANIDVGGYTWGRYGFTADFNEVGSIIKNARGKISEDIEKQAQTIFDDFYTRNSSKVRFPMRILTEQPWGKDLLLSSAWDGEIDLTDKNAVDLFKRYVSTRIQ